MLNKEMLNKIKEYDNICIFGHTFPDGDCYGAQSGLKQFLIENFTCNVYILGSGFSKAIPYFGKMDEVSDEVVKSSLAILVDCSDLERVEDKRITLAKEIVKFDHHLGSDLSTFASINISNTQASSASQMIGEFIIDNGYILSKEVAERIFLGMVTDTGRFQYLTSSKGTFALLEKIMEAKIDFQKIYDFLYESDERSTRAKGYISYSFKTYKRIAYIVLDKKTLKELNMDANYASTMVNCLSLMKEYPIWVMFSENEDGLVRVELRAKKYNVQQVATLFGGGGHLNASGCRLKSINEYQNVLDELLKIVEE